MSISSYEQYTANDYRDQDFVDVPTIAGRPDLPTVGNNQFGTYDIRSKTQESATCRRTPALSATWPACGGQRTRSTATSSVATAWRRPPAAATSPSSPTNYYTDIYNINKAVFGQATWDFAPTWTLVAGLRRNEESGYNYIRNFYTDQLDRKRPSCQVRSASTSSRASATRTSPPPAS
jgi:iron complex outermembrane receptor protein